MHKARFILPKGKKNKLKISLRTRCLYVSVPLSTSEPIITFYVIYEGSQAIEGDHDTIISNVVASTIPKLRTFELLRGVQNLH
jgi:hypothetical protein